MHEESTVTAKKVKKKVQNVVDKLGKKLVKKEKNKKG
jgi:hypothetical protein